MAEEESETVQAFWRLPEALVEDCATIDPDGNWAEGFRLLLAESVESDRELLSEGPSVSKSMSVPRETMAYLQREAERLSEKTGQAWSPMQVAREIWRRDRLAGV